MKPWLDAAGEVAVVTVAYGGVTVLLHHLASKSQGKEVPRTGGRIEVKALATGCILALALRPLVGSLRLGSLGVTASVWMFLLLLTFLLNMIEITVFTEGRSPVRLRDVIGAVLVSGVTASAVGAVTTTAAPGALMKNLAEWFNAFGWKEGVGRVLGAAVAYMVAYIVIGSATWPLVRSYYSNPSTGLRLRVPSGGVIIPLQTGRGLFVTLAVLPLAASTAAHGWDWGLRFWLALSASGAVVPLVLAREWPLRLRLIHGVEITVFFMVLTPALWWMLAARS